MVENERADFLVVHDRHHLFGEPVHVAVGPLKPERRLGAEFVGLRGGINVGEVHLEHDLTQRHQPAHDLEDLLHLLRRIAALQGGGIRPVARFRHPDEGANVLRAATGQRCEHGVRGDAVLEVARLEPLAIVPDDVAEIVRVGAVREHVGDFELLPALGVGVACHDDDHLAPAQVIGPRPAAPDPLDLSLAVAEEMNFWRNSGLQCWMSSTQIIVLSPISSARFSLWISSRAAALPASSGSSETT